MNTMGSRILRAVKMTLYFRRFYYYYYSMRKLTCKECEYSWKARKNALPKKCPNPRCQSFSWNGPSTYPRPVAKRAVGSRETQNRS